MPPWILHPGECLTCLTLVSAFYFTTKIAGIQEALCPCFCCHYRHTVPFGRQPLFTSPCYLPFIFYKRVYSCSAPETSFWVALDTSNNSNKLLHQGRYKIHCIFKDNKTHIFCSKSGNSYKAGRCKEIKFFNWKKSVNLSVHMPNTCTHSFCPLNFWSTKGMNDCNQRKIIHKEIVSNLKKQGNKIPNSVISETHLGYSLNLWTTLLFSTYLSYNFTTWGIIRSVADAPTRLQAARGDDAWLLFVYPYTHGNWKRLCTLHRETPFDVGGWV